MGHRAPAVLIDLINGKKVADPLFTGLDECTPTNLGQVPGEVTPGWPSWRLTRRSRSTSARSTR